MPTAEVTGWGPDWGPNWSRLEFGAGGFTESVAVAFVGVSVWGFSDGDE